MEYVKYVVHTFNLTAIDLDVSDRDFCNEVPDICYEMYTLNIDNHTVKLMKPSSFTLLLAICISSALRITDTFPLIFYGCT